MSMSSFVGHGQEVKLRADSRTFLPGSDAMIARLNPTTEMTASIFSF